MRWFILQYRMHRSCAYRLACSQCSRQPCAACFLSSLGCACSSLDSKMDQSTVMSCPPSSSVVTAASSSDTAMFATISAELDARNDRRERIVKLSRDVTIESKRVIFLLHRVVGVDDPKSILAEAQRRLKELCERKLSAIANELRDDDSYFYARAYSPGLQEYVEAVTLLEYVERQRLLTRAEFAADGARLTAGVPLTLVDYLCGVGDLTGELMRLAVSAKVSGSGVSVGEICEFLGGINAGFERLGGTMSRDFSMKRKTLRASMLKVERARYLLRLRGEEVPTHVLADIIGQAFAAGGGEDENDGASGCNGNSFTS